MMEPFPSLAVRLAVVACSLLRGALACEGSKLSAITDALAQVDWKDLADRLNVDPGRIEEIATECGNSAKRCRRGLVQAYCDSQVAEIEVIVENIAQALDKTGNKRQADSLKKKFSIAGKVTPSSPRVPHESIYPSEDEWSTQSGGKDGQQTPSLPHNMANSLWEYFMAYSTREIVLAMLSAVVIGLLITSHCWRKDSHRLKKDRLSPPPTPPDSKKKRAEGESGLPVYWEPMTDPNSGKEVPLRVIDLPSGSKEYKFALAEFHKTMMQGTNYNAIVTIRRIQNPTLYGQYTAKKKYLDTHNPSGVQNERWLFHGTTSTAVPRINQTNFNRSFRGQNGTVYGQGCYFVRDASYSNSRAVPDAQGLKYMYLVRVLIGQYTIGNSSMIVAPPKDPKDPAVSFDSVVNHTSNPIIFVVFYDADAYPEYLIVYK